MHDTLLWLPLTLALYSGALALQRACRMNALVNPLLVTIGALAACLVLTQTPIERFQRAVTILNFLLGTAVVALAVPLHGLLRRFGSKALSLMPAILLGSAGGTALAIEVAARLGASKSGVATVAPRGSTAAIATEISRLAGGVPAATILICIFSGLLGAVVGPILLDRLRILSPNARGLAYGVASQAIGTSRAFMESEETGSWAALAMCTSGVSTAVFVHLLMAN